MRLPALRSQARPVASLAALTAAALLVAGCSGSGSSSGPPSSPKKAGASSHSPSPSWDPRPVDVQSVAAVGDSITRGFDACSVLSDCPQVSWVTGTDARVKSFAYRLLPRAERSHHSPGVTAGRSWNLARSGARMRDLPAQVARAVRKKPDLVAVLIGSNDACRSSATAMTPVEDFRASFEESLRMVHSALPRTRVLVGSIPNLERLWRVGRSQALAKQVWQLGICPSMLTRPDSLAKADVSRRAAVTERVDAYNEVLEETCARFTACRYDGGAVHAYAFSARELSPWDWFHPSVRGQAELARILYDVAFGRGSADERAAAGSGEGEGDM